MTPVRLEHSYFVVAVPDEDDTWRFFRCDVRHNTQKPGNWFLLGLQVSQALVLEGGRRVQFRNYIAAVCASD